MTDLILGIIDSLREKYGFKMVGFAGGKGVRLVFNGGKIANIYDYDFGLNSSSVANLVNNRVDFLRTLAECSVPCTEVLVLKADNPKSVQLKLETLLKSEGAYNICICNSPKVRKISNNNELYEYLDMQEYPTSFEISVATDRIGGYSVLIQKGMVACVMCSMSSYIIGDGESAIWELLSAERITEYNQNLDLNQIPMPNEKVYIGDPNRNVGLKLEEVTDFKIVSDIARLVNFANSKIGLNFGIYNIFYRSGEYIIDGATTRVDLTNFAVNTNSLVKTCNIIENAIKQLSC